MTSEQALTALLAGTGLKVNKDPSGAIAIFPAEAGAGDASTKTAGNDQQLEEVIVTATAVSQIYVTSRSATRLDTDPMDLPLSISAVQGDLMQMQQSKTLTDVLNNVAGADVSASNRVTMRGHTASVARNGTIQTGGLNTDLVSLRPTVSVDRVEVVKGPEQILQGSGAGIGGTVNLITKLPEAQPLAYLGAAAGSDGYWRLDADLNDTLLGDEGSRLMGRLVGSTSGAGKTDVGYDGASNDFVSAGLRGVNEDWGSDLAVVYEYNRSSQPPEGRVVTFGDSFHSGMKTYAFGPKNVYSAIDNSTIDVNFKQRLWQSWTFTANYIWDDRTLSSRYTFPVAVLPPVTVLSFSGYGPASVGHTTSNDLKLDIRGEVQTGPVQHKLLLAYDYNNTVNSRRAGSRYLDTYYTDLDTMEQTVEPAVFTLPGSRGTWDETGVLVIDQPTWNSWSGLFGVRWVSVDDGGRVFGSPEVDKNSQSSTLPQYGLVYRVTPSVSIYGSGGEGYAYNGWALDWKGQKVPDETSTQYEVGTKALLFNQQIAVTLALYRIHQVNVATPDPDPDHELLPDGECCAWTTIPGLISKGVEFEVSGEPIRGLQMRANYTYTQQEDEDGNPPGFGYVPSSFDLWAQYWLSRETGQGWWGALGLTAKNAPTHNEWTPDVPGYTTFDLQVGYSSAHWNAIGGFKNVADIQTFYPTSQYDQFGTPQPGASFTFDLSYSF